MAHLQAQKGKPVEGKVKKPIGLLEPQYRYFLNPYPDVKFSRCPACAAKMGQRKLPLVIHVDPRHLISLSYTHHYCGRCDILIGNKHEIEHLLFNIFSANNPYAIGNDYTIVGTMTEETWRKGLNKPQPLGDALREVHELRSFEEIRMTMSGGSPEDEETPVITPPPSTQWTSRKLTNHS
jgi:hypothetical protein